MNNLQSKCIRNSNTVIQENVFENVIWKLLGILPQPQCVDNNIQCITPESFFYEKDIGFKYCKLDMSTARRRLKSPQSLSGTSAHPTMVTLVNIMVMNGWLTSFSFHVNRPSQSWDKAISDSDLEISTPRSRSWVWSKAKVIQLAQYHINSPRFHFTSIRPTIPEIELFRNMTLKHPRSRSWVRAKVKVTYCIQYLTDALPFCFTSIGPTIPEIWPK